MKPDEAIELLKNMKWSITTKFNAVNNSTKALDMAISALEKQEQDRWIPVTEGLPKEDGDYFVTNFVCDKLYVEESTYIICDNGDVFWTSQNVIAWMPKPEPYTEEES